ncbi:hypothetical protein KC322_g28 [Hortaea werneckii]|nr:hypothetical protein KC322_g28 [Hortaea werneckii]
MQTTQWLSSPSLSSIKPPVPLSAPSEPSDLDLRMLIYNRNLSRYPCHLAHHLSRSAAHQSPTRNPQTSNHRHRIPRVWPLPPDLLSDSDRREVPPLYEPRTTECRHDNADPGGQVRSSVGRLSCAAIMSNVHVTVQQQVPRHEVTRGMDVAIETRMNAITKTKTLLRPFCKPSHQSPQLLDIMTDLIRPSSTTSNSPTSPTPQETSLPPIPKTHAYTCALASLFLPSRRRQARLETSSAATRALLLRRRLLLVLLWWVALRRSVLHLLRWVAAVLLGRWGASVGAREGFWGLTRLAVEVFAVLEGGSAGGASAYVGFGMALRDIWTYCAVIVRERCWKCLGILVDSRLSADQFLFRRATMRLRRWVGHRVLCLALCGIDSRDAQPEPKSGRRLPSKLVNGGHSRFQTRSKQEVADEFKRSSLSRWRPPKHRARLRPSEATRLVPSHPFQALASYDNGSRSSLAKSLAKASALPIPRSLRQQQTNILRNERDKGDAEPIKESKAIPRQSTRLAALHSCPWIKPASHKPSTLHLH